MTGFDLRAGRLFWGAAAAVCAVLLAAGLFALSDVAASASADEGEGDDGFNGAGFGSSVITNPQECEDTGLCRIEVVGEFDAGEMGAGSVQFRFTDDWSGVTGQHGSCSVPVEGTNSFTWLTPEGDSLMMTQTLGFACPSENGQFWQWKRWLRVEEGTGRFDGVRGTVFVSGSRTVETGAESWTFEGDIEYPRSAATRDGCFRAYFVGDLIVIPPRGMPPPVPPSASFWLCGDDVSLRWPLPREGYEIFNPNPAPDPAD